MGKAVPNRIPFAFYHHHWRIYKLNSWYKTEEALEWECEQWDAYPYLDVPHLHFQFSEDISMVREDAAVTTQVVAAVCILRFTHGIALTLADFLVIRRLKQKWFTINIKANYTLTKMWVKKIGVLRRYLAALNLTTTNGILGGGLFSKFHVTNSKRVLQIFGRY